MINKNPFVMTLIALLLIVSIGACSSDEGAENGSSVKTDQEAKASAVLRISLMNDDLEETFRVAYRKSKDQFNNIDKMKLNSVDSNSLKKACGKKTDILYTKSSLSDSEKKQCGSDNFQLVDFPLTTLKSSGDTVSLYANESSLAENEVNDYLNTLFQTTKKPSNLPSSYSPSDTSIVNRNKGLLMIHGS